MREIQTERLRVRAVQDDDVDGLHNLWTDREVRRYLWDGRVISTDQVREVVATSQVDFDEIGTGFFAVESLDPDLAECGVIIGFCGFRRFEEGGLTELLYGVMPRYWGQGIATEAANAALRFTFDQPGIASVIAATDTPNQRSVRVLQRLGMSFHERKQWHGLDTVFYTMAVEDFVKAPAS